MLQPAPMGQVDSQTPSKIGTRVNISCFGGRASEAGNRTCHVPGVALEPHLGLSADLDAGLPLSAAAVGGRGQRGSAGREFSFSGAVSLMAKVETRNSHSQKLLATLAQPPTTLLCILIFTMRCQEAKKSKISPFLSI